MYMRRLSVMEISHGQRKDSARGRFWRRIIWTYPLMAAVGKIENDAGCTSLETPQTLLGAGNIPGSLHIPLGEMGLTKGIQNAYKNQRLKMLKCRINSGGTKKMAHAKALRRSYGEWRLCYSATKIDR